MKKIVTVPEAIRMFRVLFLNSSEKVPERIMTEKLIFQMSPN